MVQLKKMRKARLKTVNSKTKKKGKQVFGVINARQIQNDKTSSQTKKTKINEINVLDWCLKFPFKAKGTTSRYLLY